MDSTHEKKRKYIAFKLKQADIATLFLICTTPDHLCHEILVNHSFETYIKSSYLTTAVFDLLLDYVTLYPTIYSHLVSLDDTYYLEKLCSHPRKPPYIDGLPLGRVPGPLALACEQEKLLHVQILLRAGAILTSRTSSGDMLIMHISSYCSSEFFSQILPILIHYFGPDCVNATDRYGCTALHYCYKSWTISTLKMGKILVQNGADPKIKNKKGFTPIDYYRQGPMLSCYKYI